jgi:hypothetical protein
MKTVLWGCKSLRLAPTSDRTNFIEHNPWKASSCSASQIIRVMWNLNVHYSVHKSPAILSPCVTLRNVMIFFMVRSYQSPAPLFGCPRLLNAVHFLLRYTFWYRCVEMNLFISRCFIRKEHWNSFERISVTLILFSSDIRATCPAHIILDAVSLIPLCDRNTDKKKHGW